MTNIENIVKLTSSLKLLYVEDDVRTRESALMLLTDFFDEITIAVDGRDGVDKFKENEIDLIITDINMPCLNGLEMIKEIQCIDNDIPIIALSAHVEAPYLVECISLNVKGYLIKPLDLGSLINVFENVISNIILSKELEKNAKLKEKYYQNLQLIVNNSVDPMMVINEDYSVELMNNISINHSDHSFIVDKSKQKCYEITYNRSSPCDNSEYKCPLQSILENNTAIKVLHTCNNDGNKRHIEIAASPYFDDNNICKGIIRSSRDITTHIEIQEELENQKKMLYNQVYHDDLTGIANKVLFDNRLKQSMLRAEQNKEELALFFVDLNKFKQINDSLGDKAGDVILKTIVSSMKKEMHEEDTLSRISEKEFAIVMENFGDTKNIELFAKKILKAIEEPVIYEDQSLTISANIGIAIYPEHACEAQDLLKCANIAMYDAKYTNEKILFYFQESH